MSASPSGGSAASTSGTSTSGASPASTSGASTRRAFADRLRDDLAAAQGDLARLRDDVRVQLHLGRKEAGDLWRAVEPRLQAAEQRLADAARKVGDDAEEARLQAHLGVAEVKRAWPGLERAVGDLLDDVKQAGADVRTSLDEARVRAHLAAMEASAVGERAVTGLQRATDHLDRQTKATLDELRASLSALGKKLR